MVGCRIAGGSPHSPRRLRVPHHRHESRRFARQHWLRYQQHPHLRVDEWRKLSTEGHFARPARADERAVSLQTRRLLHGRRLHLQRARSVSFSPSFIVSLGRIALVAQRPIVVKLSRGRCDDLSVCTYVRASVGRHVQCIVDKRRIGSGSCLAS